MSASKFKGHLNIAYKNYQNQKLTTEQITKIIIYYYEGKSIDDIYRYLKARIQKDSIKSVLCDYFRVA